MCFDDKWAFVEHKFEAVSDGRVKAAGMYQSLVLQFFWGPEVGTFSAPSVHSADPKGFFNACSSNKGVYKSSLLIVTQEPAAELKCRRTSLTTYLASTQLEIRACVL